MHALGKLPGATPKQSLKFNEECIVRYGQVKLVACGIPTGCLKVAGRLEHGAAVRKPPEWTPAVRSKARTRFATM
jgi:hypothetical protein